MIRLPKKSYGHFPAEEEGGHFQEVLGPQKLFEGGRVWAQIKEEIIKAFQKNIGLGKLKIAPTDSLNHFVWKTPRTPLVVLTISYLEQS